MSVTELIREVYNTTNHTDPSDIADEVLTRTDEADVFEYYKQMLRGTVQSFLSGERRRIRNEAISEKIKSGKITAQPKRTVADRSRSWWQEFKRSVICTEDGMKAAGDCTREDWLFAAGSLRANAKAQERLADAYESLAVLVGDGVTADVSEDATGAVAA